MLHRYYNYALRVPMIFFMGLEYPYRYCTCTSRVMKIVYTGCRSNPYNELCFFEFNQVTVTPKLLFFLFPQLSHVLSFCMTELDFVKVPTNLSLLRRFVSRFFSPMVFLLQKLSNCRCIEIFDNYLMANMKDR